MSIKVNNLFYTYSKKTPFQYEALNDVSLEIKDGEFVALVGKTGSGKTTLVQHLNGLLLPTDGSIDVFDYHIESNKRKNKDLHNLRKRVGLVFQFPEYQLFEETVEKDVAFGPKNFKYSEEESLKMAHEALLKVGLDETYFERSPFELSGGEKRRVALAGILALDIDVLVLDEPTVGLDPKGSEQIMSLVEKMNKEGKTIILVTHDMELVNRYASRVIHVEKGKIVFDGKPKDLFLNCDGSSIEIPPFYSFIKSLKEEGLDIDVDKIKSIKDLIKEIKHV